MKSGLLKKSKKSLLLTATGALAIVATAHAYQAEEQSYIIQGASPSTMVELVQSVGGEVIQDITVTGGISASLTAQEVIMLKQKHALLRFDGKSTDDKIAGFVWKKLGKQGEQAKEFSVDNKVAGFVWKKLGKKGEKATQEFTSDDKIAGFVWKRLGKKGEQATEEFNLDSKVAGFVWKKLGKKGEQIS